MAKEKHMIRSWITKKKLKDFKQLMNSLIELYNEVIVMSRHALAEDEDKRRDLVLRAKTLLKYLRDWYYESGSIIKSDHRQIATATDMIAEEIEQMLQWLTVWTILSTREMKEAITKSAYEIANGLTAPLAIDRFSELVHDTTFYWIKHLSAINSIWNYLKHTVDCELGIVPEIKD